LLDVKGYELNGADHYAAIWEQRGGPTLITHHGMSSDLYSTLYAQYHDQGYRLVHVSGYGVNGVALFAAIWEQNDDGKDLPIGEHNLSAEKFQYLFNLHGSQGYRLIDLDAYTVNDVPYYAGVWEKSADPSPEVHHIMTEPEYRRIFAEKLDQGYRLARLSPYVVSGYPMYAAIWETSNDRVWVSEHQMTDPQYRSLFSQHVSDEFRLRSVSGYVVDLTVPNVPASGVPVPQLVSFDNAMKRFVAGRNIPAAVICVSRNGKIILERAYGYQDRANTIPLKPSALFRIASVTKPFTAAAIQKQVADHRLNLNAHVFDLGQSPGGILHITPYVQPFDPRLQDITVNHLLYHAGGWDSDSSKFDPMFESISIAQQLNEPSPPSQIDTVRYMLGRFLDFTPGTKTNY
jgi:Beta-lactamase/Bacterial tandem repeat domain 1